MLQLYCCRRILSRIVILSFDVMFNSETCFFKITSKMLEIRLSNLLSTYRKSAILRRLTQVVHVYRLWCMKYRKKAKNDVNNRAVQPQNDVIIKK